MKKHSGATARTIDALASYISAQEPTAK
jgi:hypothetical protein